jgi:hypothetical protein
MFGSNAVDGGTKGMARADGTALLMLFTAFGVTSTGRIMGYAKWSADFTIISACYLDDGVAHCLGVDAWVHLLA